MKVGICLPQFTEDPSVTVAAAVEAEELGYDSVSLFDHLLPLGGPVERPVLESFTMLTAVAAATGRVRLLPLVARAGLRPPALTAALAATLDRVSGGRFVLGLGAGDKASEREDSAVGLPVGLTQDERRAQVVETVRAVREAAPGVPIWLGGTSSKMRLLAEEIADAWNVWDAAPRPAKVPVTWAGPAPREDPEGLVATLREAGVAEALFSFPGGDAAERRRDLARRLRLG